MKIYADKLPGHLQGELLPIYLVSGDEPLQQGESADRIRAAARAAGFTSREVLFVEPGFSWSQLGALGGSLSLFAERRLIELRMPTGKPGNEGTDALKAWAADPPPDTLLLVISGKPSGQPAWVKALAKTGGHVQVWPLDAAQLPRWIDQRMRERDLQPERDAVRLLAGRVEGNLLAASQEIDKLAMLHSGGAVSLADVEASVADSARFNVFQLAETALEGKAARSVRMLEELRGEDTPPQLVLWALGRAIHELGQPPRQAPNRALAKQQARLSEARKRLSPRVRSELTLRLAHADRVLKGAARGDGWAELVNLCLGLAGRPA